MNGKTENAGENKFRDCYGVFLLVGCPLCGKLTRQPLYKGTKLKAIYCNHGGQVIAEPRELILQRMRAGESDGGDSHLYLDYRRN